MTQRIYWTHDERRRLVEDVAQWMTSPTFERGELLLLMQRAQRVVLPKERQRIRLAQGRLTSRDYSRTKQAAIECYLKLQRGERSTAPSQSSVSHEETLPAHDHRLEDALNIIVTYICNRVLEELAVTATPHLHAIVQAAIAEARSAGESHPPASDIPSETAHPAAPGVEAQPARPRVLIVGTKPEWERSLKKQFEPELKLMFFNDRFGSSGLDRTAKRADHIIMNSSRCRHSHQAVLRATKRPFKITSGALSAIESALTEIYVEHPPATTS